MSGLVVPNANTSLIKRFNQHSTMVLKSCDRQPAAVVDTDAKADETTVVNGSVENVSRNIYDDLIIEKQVNDFLLLLHERDNLYVCLYVCMYV